MEKNTRIIIPLLFLTKSLSLAKLTRFWRKNRGLSNKDNLPVYRICISSYGLNHFTEKTIDGFCSQLAKSTKAFYEIKKFNACGNKNRMRSQTEEIILAKPNLIFTTGETCSTMAQELTKKRKSNIPIVFGGVKDPLGVGLIDSENSPGNNITGVTGIAMTWENQLDILFEVLPGVRSAAIIGNSYASKGVEKDIQEICSVFNQQGLSITVLHCDKVNQVIQKTKEFLTSSPVDILFCLRDDTTIACMDALVSMCNQVKIPIFSAYLDGVKQGATLGLGIAEEKFGLKSAELALKILEQGSSPSALPLVKIESDDYQIAINQSVAEKQGLNINKHLLFVLRNRKYFWKI